MEIGDFYSNTKILGNKKLIIEGEILDVNYNGIFESVILILNQRSIESFKNYGWLLDSRIFEVSSVKKPI
jgi:hypothetical protein